MAEELNEQNQQPLPEAETSMPAEPPAEAPAAPQAETPVEPSAESQAQPTAETPAEPAEPQAEPQTEASAEPQAEAQASPPAEPQDGPVEDTPEEAAEAAAAAESGESAESQDAESDVNLAILESLLFSTHHPLTTQRLAELLELDSSKPLRKAIKLLNKQYEDTGRSFRVEQVAGGYQLLTLPEYGEYLKKLHQREVDTKLTKAALETLAIIAYKQPILRADIEAIRGVASGETVRSLMEKHLVKIAGRAEEPGRPILYGTTKRFLELFGLNNLKDLPQAEELTKPQT